MSARRKIAKLSPRRQPAHLPKDRPVEIVEEIRLPPDQAAVADHDWMDLLQAMERRPGCLGLQWQRTGDGFRVASRWTSWRNFVDWTGATIYAVLAARLTGRRVVASPLGDMS